MSRSGFVLYISGKCFLVGKPGGNAGGVGQVSASVITYIDDLSVAGGQVEENFIQVAIAHSGTETFITNISYIIIEYFIL